MPEFHECRFTTDEVKTFREMPMELQGLRHDLRNFFTNWDIIYPKILGLLEKQAATNGYLRGAGGKEAGSNGEGSGIQLRELLQMIGVLAAIVFWVIAILLK